VGVYHKKWYQMITRGDCKREKKNKSIKIQTRGASRVSSPTRRPLSPLFSFIIGDDLTLDLKPVVLLHAFDVNVTKCGHWGQNSSASDSFVREFVEVEGEGKSGFGNHTSSPEVARFTLSPYDGLDFG
jgi:hypothetical protein